MPGKGVVHFELEERSLENGLRVIVQEDNTAPVVSVHIMYHVGSKHERRGRTGFAHLFEHLMFQGSEHVPDEAHFRLVQDSGGTLNGSTWFDRTNYFETLPSNEIELGLWLESDRLGWFESAMTQEKLDNQRAVVKNERRQ
ncbi:MAG: insulinase family protein, partial [Gemmatimonadales bacterium]